MNGSTRKLKKKFKKIHGNKWKWKQHGLKSLGWNKSGHKREVYSNTGQPQEARKISNTRSNLTPKGARKRTANEG